MVFSHDMVVQTPTLSFVLMLIVPDINNVLLILFILKQASYM